MGGKAAIGDRLDAADRVCASQIVWMFLSCAPRISESATRSAKVESTGNEARLKVTDWL